MAMLPDDEYRYRVVKVYMAEESELLVEPGVQEYKTLEGAEACQRTWIGEGHSVVLQVGTLHWLSPEDHDAEVARIDKADAELDA